MSEQTAPASRLEALRNEIRQVRNRYDALERGRTAAIRRCKDADDVVLEAAFWHVGAELARAERYLPHVVLLFPVVSHKTQVRFSFGRYLRTQLGDGDGANLRFRRLLDSRDRDELSHRLRAVLRLAGGSGAPVDWGVLGADILWFFAASESVKRRWAQDFYAPLPASSESANP